MKGKIYGTKEQNDELNTWHFPSFLPDIPSHLFHRQPRTMFLSFSSGYGFYGAFQYLGLWFLTSNCARQVLSTHFKRYLGREVSQEVAFSAKPWEKSNKSEPEFSASKCALFTNTFPICFPSLSFPKKVTFLFK